MSPEKNKSPTQVPSDSPIPLEKSKRNLYVIACSLLACMTTIVLGYDIGVMSGAIIFIEEQFHLTSTQKEVIMGILNLYSLVGSALAGRTSDWLGRRFTIVLSGVIFCMGGILMGCATNYAFLMVGRFVAGVGVGYGFMIAPVYTSEVAPTASRGFLSSLPEVFINVGILLGYVSNFFLAKLPDHIGWRIMLGIGAIPAAGIALGVLVMPESPRWLVLQGRLGEAKRVLEKTSNSAEEARERLADIKLTAGIPDDCDDEIVPVSKQHHGEGVWRELAFPTVPVRHILMVAIGIHFFQQFSGIDTVVLYSPVIFKKAGIQKKNDLLLATVGVGFVKTISILVATFLVDRVGRRALLLSSISGMLVSLICLGTGLTVVGHSDEKLTWAIALSIAGVLCFVAMFSIGIGPVTWVYCSEVFPLRLRSQGCALGVGVNRVTSGVISMTFLSLSRGITVGGAFYLYAGMMAVALVYFYLLAPETQGRSLEEIEEMFGTFWGWKKTARVLDEKRRRGLEMGKIHT